jgi:Transmembrane exosortase (Exosortase_EpsH)
MIFMKKECQRCDRRIVDSGKSVGNTLLRNCLTHFLMSLNPTEPITRESQIVGPDASKITLWVSVLLAAVILCWFYGMVPRYGPPRDQSAIDWIIYSAWNEENDYEHGKLFPFVVIGLIIYRLKDLKAAVSGGDLRGYFLIFLGALLYLIAYRTFQPRIAMGGLPFILLGSAWSLWGLRVAKMLAFPLFFFWLAIPASNDTLAAFGDFARASWLWIVRRRNLRRRNQGATAERRLATVGHCERLQRYALTHGTFDDFGGMGLYREDGPMEKNRLISHGISLGDSG